jgi:alkylhydroperoxidase/carboxymuconolactone decarboxylase family protein YurZ
LKFLLNLSEELWREKIEAKSSTPTLNLITKKGGHSMAEHPLKIFEKIDPELLKLAQDTSAFALADGALPRKFKLLIAMALDASHGAVQGVRSLAEQAMKAGATKEEIAETLRVTQYVSGVGSVYTAAHALKELF